MTAKATDVPSPVPPRKGYSRLVAGRRVTPEYEIVSSDLHYNYPYRFELSGDIPVADWYYRYREGSRLSADDWEAFSDPRRTTYRGYNDLQDRKEDVVDGLLRQIDELRYDDELTDGWAAFLDQWYGPLRFAVHGLQMLAAYIAQLAPASRITNCAAFQAADEMRRLQRIAYRTAQLCAHRSELGVTEHRRVWEEADEFQPLRELIERALVAYDWGEALVVTNVVIKPCIDRVINEEIAGALAVANGDPVLRDIHFSLDEDAHWHRQWTAALLRVATRDRPANAEVVSGWVDAWLPLAAEAVRGLASVAAQPPVPLDPPILEESIAARVSGELAAFLDG